jgi:hypothetical protein
MPFQKGHSGHRKIDAGNRPTRTPLGQRNRLTFGNLDPDYQYRIVNDKDDRIKAALEGGYEFVESDDTLGDVRVAEASKVGKNVSKPVGGGTTGFLMRIKKEWYDEDQQRKLEAVERTESAMQRTGDSTKADTSGTYGEGLQNK